MTVFSISYSPDIAAATLPHPPIFATMLNRKCMGVEDLLQGFPQLGEWGVAIFFGTGPRIPQNPLRASRLAGLPEESPPRLRGRLESGGTDLIIWKARWHRQANMYRCHIRGDGFLRQYAEAGTAIIIDEKNA